MSEVQKLITRYSRDFSGNLSVDPNGSWVLAADAANRDKRLTDQLAALREELAGLQDSCAIDRRHLDRMIDHGDDLQQRLADAERRNAVLVNLLRETCGHYSVLTGIILTLSREDQLTSEPMRKSAYAACDHGKKINAALNKPEEAKS
jgi:hypothetical protein